MVQPIVGSCNCFPALIAISKTSWHVVYSMTVFRYHCLSLGTWHMAPYSDQPITNVVHQNVEEDVELIRIQLRLSFVTCDGFESSE
jgi:hypothetical protein